MFKASMHTIVETLNDPNIHDLHFLKENVFHYLQQKEPKTIVLMIKRKNQPLSEVVDLSGQPGYLQLDSQFPLYEEIQENSRYRPKK